PLLNIVDTNLEDPTDKEVAQHIIKLISKADKFSWELKNKKPWVDNISNRRDTMPRIDRYACNGTIQINIERAYNLAVNNLLTVPQLYENIKNEKIDGFLHITRHQIYYWSKKLAVKKYKLADNQLESARLYLENNSSFKLLYQDQYTLAFVTPLLFLLPNKVTRTIVIDATF
ncbi:20102_t:CDS:2, partial [Racocetra persica]